MFSAAFPCAKQAQSASTRECPVPRAISHAKNGIPLARTQQCSPSNLVVKSTYATQRWEPLKSVMSRSKEATRASCNQTTVTHAKVANRSSYAMQKAPGPALWRCGGICRGVVLLSTLRGASTRSFSFSWRMARGFSSWHAGIGGANRLPMRHHVSGARGESAAVDGAAVGGKEFDQTRIQRTIMWKPLPAPPEPEPIPVAVPDAETPPWTSRIWASPVDMKRRIFCNRSLNMKSIVAVGFDMDYTLAQYRPDTFETLAYALTVKQLVHKLGYPKEVLDWKFDWRYMIRGLVLDKKRGNILKMDRHKYVKVAYHGFRELSREERMATYGNAPFRESFDEPDFALIDTLFSLAEAYLFSQLVDFKDLHPELIPNATSSNYSSIYRDVRDAVDLCHRDGSLKQAVAADPSKYIYMDQQIVPMLEMLRKTGRSTFIVTNSLWDYTHVVMNYLCGKCGTDGGTPRDDKWLEYFDVVITGSAKPGFFSDSARAPLFQVEAATGMLYNTDNGSPLVQIGNVGRDLAALDGNGSSVSGSRSRVFQGGNYTHLHRMLNVDSGSKILYVGDHIYGDILRSKKQLGWRTMMVVPELERELQMLSRTQDIRRRFHGLRQQRDALDDSLQRLQWSLLHDISNKADLENAQQQITELKELRNEVREAYRVAQRSLHGHFHTVWGQLMKTGYQNSRFAHQVERFACLYTSHVANLCYYSPDKSYRTTEDFMPHELEILDP